MELVALVDRLERVMPSDVRIESIAPSFDKSGMVHLTMAAVAKDSNGMVNMLDRLNRDPHFARAFPTTENHTPNGFQFGVGVEYRPSVARVIE